jgi:vacuolar-type H+-ATPase subunit H
MAGIIKAAGSSDAAVTGAAQAFHFHDVGESYVSRVRGEAARIVADARQEAARIKAKAVEEGREAAIQAAQASLRSRLDQQLTSVLAALRQAAQTIDQSRHAWQQHWEQHTVALACAIANRVCRRELSRQPQITLAWVREAIELAAGTRKSPYGCMPTIMPRSQRKSKQSPSNCRASATSESSPIRPSPPAAAASIPNLARSICSSSSNWPA